MIKEQDMNSQYPSFNNNQHEWATRMPLSVQLQINAAYKDINRQITPGNVGTPAIDFPINTLSEDLRGIISTIHHETKAPEGLIASSLLSAMSLACQDLIDVKTPNGITYPSTLFIITRALSGERKSSVDSVIWKMIIEKQQELAMKFDSDCQQYEIEMNVWNIEKKAQSDLLVGAIKSRMDCDEIRNGLLKIEERKPCKPKQVKWMLNDVTSAAIKKSIVDYGGSLGVYSDEAGSLFSSDFLRKTADLNSLWGAKALNVERAASKSISDIDYRFGLSLMVQPDIFEDFLKKQGAQARASGFFARCLISQPISTQGTRFIVENDSNFCEENGEKIMSEFYERVSELLQRSLNRRSQCKIREFLSFSPEASKRWVDLYNQIENGLGPYGMFKQVSDFASKFMEHVSRVAAVLQYFSTKNTEITEHTLFSAIAIIEWYFSNFIKLFGENTTPDYIRNAEELKLWLQIQFSNVSVTSIKKNTIRQRGPYCIRDKDKLNHALTHLKNLGYISIVTIDRTQYVNLSVYPSGYKGL